MRLIMLVLSGWLLGSSLMAVEAPPRVSVPPRRVSFAAVAPVDVQVGKLWWDIGLFHPFTGRVSRDAWEAKYFRLMNRACEPGADAHALIAEAVGYLEDPATLLLEAGEGEGRHFLPVLWEVRGQEVWAVGGERGQIGKVCGQLRTIDGVPLDTWLTRRLGPIHAPGRIYTALALACRRPEAFRRSFGFQGGESLDIHSLEGLSGLKEPWIEGGWKGKTLREVALEIKQKGNSVDRYKAVAFDFRDEPFVSVAAESGLENQLVLLSIRAKPMEVVRIVREHRGQFDTDWDRYEHGSLLFNRIGAHPAPNHFIGLPRDLGISVALPPVLVDELLAETLAGWSLPAERNEAARTAYCDQPDGSRLRIRLQSWCRGLQDARHQASYANGSLLSVPAAKALAAATMINFDHYFAFTPEHLQEQVFRDLLALKEHAQSVEEMVVKSGGPTRDIHAPLWAFHGINASYISAVNDQLWLDSGKNKLPSMTIPTHYFENIGKLMVIRSTSTGFRVGQSIRAINGHSVQELLLQSAWNASRPEVLDRYTSTNHITLCLPKSGDGPYNVQVENRDGSLITLSISENDYGYGDERYIGPMPSGWYLVNTDNRMSLGDIKAHLEQGDNIIWDMREGQSVVECDFHRVFKEEGNLNIATIIRTPHSPTGWGESDCRGRKVTELDSSLSVSANLITSSGGSKHYNGKCIIVVDGTSQSQSEIEAILARSVITHSSRIVGWPTAGTLGNMTTLVLHVGQGSQIVKYGPTVTQKIINGANYNYKGIPLDYILTENDVLKHVINGVRDPVIHTIVEKIRDNILP